MTQPKKTMRGNRRRARPRVLAEALLKNPLDAGSEISSGEVQKLVHELQVRQTELETQNEELRRVQFELECSRDNFERLYDQSPVGYLTLDVNGVIREVNLTAARLLGNDRRALLKRKLSRYFTSESWDDYCLHQQQVCTTGSRQTCEVQIRRPDGASFTAHLEIALAQSDPGRPARCLVTLIDVTRQRQAEAALRENQAQLAGIIRSAMDGIIMVNRHQRIVVGNEAAERIFGCNPGQLVGRQLNELIPTADRHIRSLRETCVTQRATDSAIQISGLRADGVEFPIEASISQTAQIGEECFTVILRDISERVKAEERLRATLESIGDGFVGCDADWRFVYVNAPAERLLGIRREDVLGRKSLWEVFPLTLSTPLEPEFRSAAAGEIRDFEYFYEPWARWFHNRCFPREGGGMSVYFRDITERKQTEEVLRATEQRYHSLVQASPDAIMVLKHGHIEFINPAGLNLLGVRSPTQVLGKSLFEFFRPKRHKIIRQQIDPIKSSSGSSLQIEEELVRPDGSTRWVNLSAAMFKEAGETAVQFILRDITERRRLEAELLAIADREQRRIGQDLHDGLGQQLAALEMKCFLLQADLAAGALATDGKELQERVRQMSQTLRESITFTRTLARGLAAVNLAADGLSVALKQLAHMTHQPGRIECRFICDAPVQMDNPQTAGHLYRIAQEAVNNSLKHARAQRITIHLTCEQNHLRLQIKDDGRGLPKRRKGRPGIGMAVMHHRAHVIGALLETESQRGRGVTITCTLALENHETS